MYFFNKINRVKTLSLFIFTYMYSLCVSKRYWDSKHLKNWISVRTSFNIKSIPNIIFGSLITLAKSSKLSDKERSKEIPSWAKGKPPKEGETADQYAKRLCDEKLGEGSWKKGANQDYNKIKKHAHRHMGLK